MMSITLQLKSDELVSIADMSVLAKYSGYVHTLISDEAAAVIIPLPEEVTKTTLDSILLFLGEHVLHDPWTIPVPLVERSLEKSGVPPYAYTFVEAMDERALIDLSNAAYAMQIPMLFSLCCAQYAASVGSLRNVELYVKFNVNVPTEDEEGKLRYAYEAAFMEDVPPIQDEFYDM